MNWYSFIQKFFGLFFAAGMALGFIFSDAFIIISNYALLILGCVMTMTFLSIDLEEALHNLKRIHITGIVFILTKAVVPFILFNLTRPLGETVSVAVLLLTLTPFAAISPTLTRIVGGDTEFILIQQVFQTLVSPFYMPFLLLLYAGSSISVDVMQMVKILIYLILIPFAISLVIRFALRGLIVRTRKYYPAASILFIALLLSGLLASAAAPIKAEPLKALPLTAGAFTLAFILILSGWFGHFFLDRKKRLAIVVGHLYMNIGLTAVIAAGFFSPEVLLFILIYELPANLLPPLLGRVKLFKTGDA